LPSSKTDSDSTGGAGDISVLIATYNRAEILRQTLQAMTQADRDRIGVEIVVVDNNSTDHTRQVVESFADSLPVRYLFEPRPGKNCALNRALDEVELGELVAFTDDDITPAEDWFKAIASASGRWPDHSVFGGRIDVAWPDVHVPDWIKAGSVDGMRFGRHDRGETEGLYPADEYPLGGNFWVRGHVFAEGRRYSEAVGPRPRHTIKGSETSLLRGLTREGFEIVYCPRAAACHRLQPELLTPAGIRARACRYGRGIPHHAGVAWPGMLVKTPTLWRLARLALLAKACLRLVGGALRWSRDERLRQLAIAFRKIGRETELLRLAGKARRDLIQQQRNEG